MLGEIVGVVEGNKLLALAVLQSDEDTGPWALGKGAEHAVVFDSGFVGLRVGDQVKDNEARFRFGAVGQETVGRGVNRLVQNFLRAVAVLLRIDRRDRADL